MARDALRALEASHRVDRLQSVKRERDDNALGQNDQEAVVVQDLYLGNVGQSENFDRFAQRLGEIGKVNAVVRTIDDLPALVFTAPLVPSPHTPL